MRRRNAEKLVRAGVILTPGTDNYIGTAPEFRREPKSVWTEPGMGTITAIEGYVELGMTTLQAITAGTKNGAIACKMQKDLGTIEVGKLADVVVLDADPVADIHNIRKINRIVRDGRVIDPGDAADQSGLVQAVAVERDVAGAATALGGSRSRARVGKLWRASCGSSCPGFEAEPSSFSCGFCMGDTRTERSAGHGAETDRVTDGRVLRPGVREPRPLPNMVRLTVTHDDLEKGSEMERKITQGWPRVLSSLKSLLETGQALKTWAGL